MKPYHGILALISYLVLQFLAAGLISAEHYEPIAGVIALFVFGWLLRKKRMLRLSSRDLKGSLLLSCVGIGIGLALLSKLTFVVGVLTQPVVLEQSSAASPAFLWVESIATKAVLIPIVEELLFRGILFGSFASSFSYKLAIPLSAAIFALVHYTVSWPMVFLIGTMLAWIYWRTGSLAAPMVIHCTVNFFALLSLPLYALLAVNRTLGILAALGLFLAGIPVTCLSTKRFLQKHDALPA